ncbi:MAG: FkbM family methyltransferase [Candidatus Bathyarchaeia archaeon]|jgi:FkbM family methyltransferase
MAKLKLIIITLKTTKNFWQLAFLKASPRKRKVFFRNGITIEVDLTGYRKIRDLLYYLGNQKFNIKKYGQAFVVSKERPLFNCLVPSVETLPFFNFLLSLTNQNWNVSQIDASTFKVDKRASSYKICSFGDRLFLAKSERISFTGPLESLTAYFLECEKGLYDYDYDGKTVLDIGGFCGESAVFFASQGARKVIIYEPVKEHHELIRKNIAMNGVKAELHEEGMGEKNGSLSINYETADLAFGLSSKGKKMVTIQIKSAQDIINQSKADIAKIDCEGAEINLASVPREVLGLIRFYIVETHTKSIQDTITKKFIESGFAQTRAPEHISGETSVVYFEKNQSFST